jgi:homoserine kinase type II
MNNNFHEILTNYYDIGQLVHIEQNHRGYINDTYEIKSLKDKKEGHYLLRRYKKGILEEKIKFEHALMHELIDQGFNLSPHVIPTKSQTTFVKIFENNEDYFENCYISIFSRLPGKDKYTWDQPFCTDTELIDAAKVLALYHSAISEWEGTDGWTGQRNIDSVVLMPDRWRHYAQIAGKSSFDQYFLEQFDYIYRELNKIRIKNTYNEMTHLAIHGDYHPGNLKFENEKVTGVFDFDWSKIDIRCFDVALSLLYFCTSWDEIDEGHLLVDRTESFLEAYQKVASDIKHIGTLNTMELVHLPEMIHIGNLSVVDWILEGFYSYDCDSQEYKTYLRHSVQVMQWMEKHRDQLSKRILKLGSIH